ncbi:MAG TPA: tripartite tricarboxylate transporter substrate binding protein [Ramlibacter sp.]|nr:tripartite tricarboxylate transporter substrate binding protein [Ramlibacter sp.]
MQARFPSRRAALSALAACCALALGAGAHAQTAWPSKPIKWVVPYAAGGTSDILTRLIAQKLTERLGQPVLIDNKTGAGGNLGTDFVAKSAPDGYTWVLGNFGPISVNPTLYKNLPYDPERDLVPITLLMAYANVLLVNPSFGPSTVKEVIASAKTKPIPYAGNGVGTSLHLTGELFARSAGVKMTHVPYKGGPPGLNDAMAGIVPMAIDPISTALPLVKAGKLKAVAVTSAERSELLPDVPTVAESGLPNFEVIGWVGVLVPRGTPPAITSRMVSEFTAIMQTPELKKAVADMGSFVPTLGPEHFAKYIRSETVKWRDVVNGANLKAE